MDAPQRNHEQGGGWDADALAVEQVVRGPGANPDDLLVFMPMGEVHLGCQRGHPLLIKFEEHYLLFERGRLGEHCVRATPGIGQRSSLPSTPKPVRRPAFSLVPQGAPAGSVRPKPAAFQALTPPRSALEFGNPSRMFLAA